MTSDNDIVTRLRVLNHHAKKLAENESLHQLHREAFTRCEDLTWQAADEIERLRKRLLAEENAYDIERRQNEHLQTDRNNLALEIERLRKERDEARWEILESLHPDLRESYAAAREWDYLKENTND